MNTPVIFPIAKLLKEKEFDKPLPSICFIKEESNYTSTILYEVLDMDFEYILRPTIAEVVMWLYEKHGIWIGVKRDYHNGALLGLESIIDYNDGFIDCGTFDSPTEAYEAGIEYCLTKLKLDI